jgi:hypothetical protein
MMQNIYISATEAGGYFTESSMGPASSFDLLVDDDDAIPGLLASASYHSELNKAQTHYTIQH